MTTAQPAFGPFGGAPVFPRLAVPTARPEPVPASSPVPANSPVFVDSSGRRRRVLATLGYLGAAACATYVTAFGVTLTTSAGALGETGTAALTPTPLPGDDEDVATVASAPVAAAPVEPIVTGPARHRATATSSTPVRHAGVTASQRRAAAPAPRVAPRPAAAPAPAPRAAAPAAPAAPRATTPAAGPTTPTSGAGNGSGNAAGKGSTKDPKGTNTQKSGTGTSATTPSTDPAKADILS